MVGARPTWRRPGRPGDCARGLLPWRCPPPENLHQNLRQSGDYAGDRPLTLDRLGELILSTIDDLDVKRARADVAPFLIDERSIEVWSTDFFAGLVKRIESID